MLLECFKYARLTFIGFVMTLEDKDIIQVDATVIIGVMILLTLSIGFDSSINSQREENITRLMITLAIIAPFTASAVLAIMTNLSNKYTEQLKKTSILIMAIGFGYLIFVIVAFMASIYYLIWLFIWILGSVNIVNIWCFQSLRKYLFTNNQKLK